MNEMRQREAAEQAAQRMIARGERTGYRVGTAQDGRLEVLGCPWPVIDANDRRPALEQTRAAVADWLGVSPAVFDVDA
jgi:hypothetical protein